MAASEAQLRANKKYLQKQDHIQLRVPSGEKEKIAAFAAEKGMSLNSFIRQSISDAMAKDSNSNR